MSSFASTGVFVAAKLIPNVFLIPLPDRRLEEGSSGKRNVTSQKCLLCLFINNIYKQILAKASTTFLVINASYSDYMRGFVR